MKDIILDTDIGCDCDDAGALALLHRLEDLGECSIKAVTSSSSRLDGAACIDAINKYYKKNIPVGMNLNQGFLDKEPYGNYSHAVSRIYPNDYKEKQAKEAVLLLRETLFQHPKKSIVLVVIGPFNNLANLLRSEKDELINKSGVELVNEKVSRVIVMGGHFPKDGEVMHLGNEIMKAEWNILQDIKSAQLVLNLCPVEIVFCPFEIGLVKTGYKLLSGNNQSPVKLCYELHSNGPRESWDPITCYYAVRDLNQLWDISPYGDIEILENGVSKFKENPLGKCRYLINNDRSNQVGKVLDELIY